MVTQQPQPTAAAPNDAPRYLSDAPRYPSDAPRYPQVSVVVPAYNERDNIAVLHGQLVDVLHQWHWELVLVDDGSQDDTFAVVSALAARDKRVIGLSLSRNFGHQYALLAGLDFARGDAVISMDADLQHPPTLLPKMLQSWQDGADIVLTCRLAAGRLPFWKVWTSKVFYAIFSRLTGVPMQEGDSDFRLLDRRVLDAVRAIDRAHLFLRGLVRWAGFQTVRLDYEVQQRHSGRSKYSLRRMLQLAVTGITAFSSIPLRAGIGLGLATSGIALCEFAFAVWSKLNGTAVPGWVSLIAVITLLFALNFVLIGVIGLYISRIFEKIQERPPYLVAHSTHGSPPPATRQRVPVPEVTA